MVEDPQGETIKLGTEPLVVTLPQTREVPPEELFEQLNAELELLNRDNLELVSALLEKYTELIRLLDTKSPLKRDVSARMQELRGIKKTLELAARPTETAVEARAVLKLRDEFRNAEVLPERDRIAFEAALGELHKIQSGLEAGERAAFDIFYRRIVDRFSQTQEQVLKARDSASVVTAFRGMTFEVSRIVRVLRQGDEELDFSKTGQELRVKYAGYGNKEINFFGPPTELKVNRIKENGRTVETGVLIDFDVPIVRNGKPYIYETKCYPRKPFGELVQVRNQLLKYREAVHEGLADGATVEVSGRVDKKFLVWAMGSRIEDRGAVPEIEIVYIQPLPSGKEYRFVLKRVLRQDASGKTIDSGLQFHNEEQYDEEDKKIIIGIEKSLAEHPSNPDSIITILAETCITAEKQQEAFRSMFPNKINSIVEFKQAVSVLFDLKMSDPDQAGRVMRGILNKDKYQFGVEQAIVDLGELAGVDPHDNPQAALEALWNHCFENPGHITSIAVFDVYDKLRNESVFQRFREQKVIINKSNTKSAVSEYARADYVEHEIRAFLDYLKKNPDIAAVKRHYILPEDKIPAAVEKVMAAIGKIAVYETNRTASGEESDARLQRKAMAYAGRPEGIALDIEHIIIDTIYGINKNGVDRPRAEGALKGLGSRRSKSESPEDIQARVREALAAFFELTDDDDRLVSKYKGLPELEAAISADLKIREWYDMIGKRSQGELQKIVQEALIARDYDWPERFMKIEDFMRSIEEQDRRYQEIHVFDPEEGKVSKHENTTDEEIRRTKINIIKENIRRARAYMERTGRAGSHKRQITRVERDLSLLEQERTVRMGQSEAGARQEAARIGERMGRLRKEQAVLQQQLSATKGEIPEDNKQRFEAITAELNALKFARVEAFAGVRAISAEYQPRLEDLYRELEEIYRQAVPTDAWIQTAQRVVHEKDENTMKVIYAVTAEGDIVVQEEVLRGDVSGRAAHSELARGRNVYGSGEFLFEKRNGKWVMVENNNGSGHYRPDANDTLPYINNLLKQKGVDVTSTHAIDAILRGRKLREASLF